MTAAIERVAVIGAGTMGAAIAAHAANAGLPVLLLDVVPQELDPKEEKKGLTLESPEVRNRIVREGFERIAKLKPASLMSAEARLLVTLGNLEDNFDQLADADWIVEAVVERLDVKRALLERIEGVRKPGSIVTTNTSGLPIASITEGRSEELRCHFFGTHFFNPPRYMLLLEVIPGDDADPAAVAEVVELATRRLGKGVVVCKDTPNFIGNRLMSIQGSFVMDYAITNGYRFEEVDAVTGPLLGRPKTATFRLQDLVGIDVASFVGKNLHGLIPDDPYRDVLASEAVSKVVGGLLERGRLGNKSGSGFYRKSKGQGGKPVFEVLDPETFDYEPQEDPSFACLETAKIRDLGERLRAVFSEKYKDDRGARLAWAATANLLEYAAERGPDIAWDLPSVDRAVRWGFSYEAGPFELWDSLGVAETAERMKASGVKVAAWVDEMLAAGCETFYRTEDGRATGYYDWESKGYRDLEDDPRHLTVADVRAEGEPLASNKSASLHDLGDDVLLLEFHSKMNAIDDGTVAMMNEARKRLREDEWKGLVIGNDGPNFCVGANLKAVAEAAAAGRTDEIREASKAMQHALRDLSRSSKPVVAAVHGMALGGGCEIAMGVDRVVAHAESYVGLVEVGVGLLPAGGGLKELVRRHLGPAMRVKETDPLPLAGKLLEIVGLAKVSTSAAEARELGFFGPEDRIVMNRDHLLSEAKEEVLTMALSGWVPRPPEPLYAGGRDLYATLRVVPWSMAQAGFASEHDALVAKKVAWVIAGGDFSAPEWVDEEHFLTLERNAFAELVATEKTQERIVHMLKTGKPLRN